MRWTKRRGEGQADADAALSRAVEARDAAKRRRPEIDAVVGRLRALRRRNHFAEMIKAALEGER